MKEKIKKWYEQGLWTADMVANAVTKGVLTEAQCEDIIGELCTKPQSVSVFSGMSPLK